MTLLTNHIENIRQQPEHTRRQIAFVVAAILTGVIALVWLGASVATGAFALKSTSFAEATSAPAPQVAKSETGFSRLVGAVGSVVGGIAKGSARVQVVDSKIEPPPPSNTTTVEPTILPF